MNYKGLSLSVNKSIALSLSIAFLCTVIPFGNHAWVPDFILITLIFWIVNKPDTINMLSAFIFGLIMDVICITPLGVHALGYVVACYLVLFWNRKLVGNTSGGQVLGVIQVLLAAHIIIITALWLLTPGLEYAFSYILIPTGLEILLWVLLKNTFLSPTTFLNSRSS